MDIKRIEGLYIFDLFPRKFTVGLHKDSFGLDYYKRYLVIASTSYSPKTCHIKIRQAYRKYFYMTNEQ